MELLSKTKNTTTHVMQVEPVFQVWLGNICQAVELIQVEDKSVADILHLLLRETETLFHNTVGVHLDTEAMAEEAQGILDEIGIALSAGRCIPLPLPPPHLQGIHVHPETYSKILTCKSMGVGCRVEGIQCHRFHRRRQGELHR